MYYIPLLNIRVHATWDLNSSGDCDIEALSLERDDFICS